MNRSLVITVLVIVVTFHARSQVVLPEKVHEEGLRENVFGLGLAVGAVSGIGLSFRHHPPGSFSYEINGGIIKVDTETNYAIGAELQYDLIRSPYVRFFADGGAGYYYSGGRRGNTLQGPGRIGFGIGAEAAVSRGLHFTGALLFTVFSDGNVFPLPQVGMHYYFY